MKLQSTPLPDQQADRETRLIRRVGRAGVAIRDGVLRTPSGWRDAISWFISLLPGHSALRDARPWMTFGAIRWLEEYLTPGMRIFEYGSGGSTLFLASRVAEVVSVEHDAAFHEVVRAELKARRLANVTLSLVSPELGGAGAEEYHSDVAAYRDRNFEGYARSIEQFADGAFDLVIVDGRVRAACARLALPKIKSDGRLLLDDSEREKYQSIARDFQRFARLDFRGLNPYSLDNSQTTVWQINERM